jgi:prophage regulatory protein
MTSLERRPVQRRVVRYRQLGPDWGISWSRMHVSRLEAAGKFPKRVHLGPSTVGWFSDELEAFLDQRASARETSAT